jgi:TolB-like protein
MDVLHFGPFQFDIAAGELRKDGERIGLQPQPARVLSLLAMNAGRTVTRAELHAEVWAGGTFVDFEQGLNFCIKQIRAALGDDAKAPRYIETLQRRGYRFAQPVRRAAARAAPTHSVSDKTTLVVLPFTNLSGDDDQEYLSDGLTDEMIAQLGRINPQRLGVIARTSAMRYKHADKSVDVIGRELGASYVLEGSVRRHGGHVRVTAQLVHASDQTQRWTGSYDRGLDDILALQSDVARAIADEVRVQLTQTEQARLARVGQVVPGAYDAYLRGRFFWNRRTRGSLAKSVECFETAIERDPTYAPAYAGLADASLTQLDYNYLRPPDAFTRANRAALEALRLDETLAEPHTSLGHLRLHEFDWQGAEREFTRAIELNPGYGAAHYYYANLLAAVGRFDEAIDEAQLALDVDPISPNARQNRVFILYIARRYDEALTQAIDILDLDSAFVSAYYYLGLIHERLGHYDEAIAAFQKMGLEPVRGATVFAALGRTYALAGRREEALQVARRLDALSTREYVSLYDFALLQFGLGDLDRGFALLSDAYDAHSSFVPFLNVDARLDDVRRDPRFEALIQRLAFPGD